MHDGIQGQYAPLVFSLYLAIAVGCLEVFPHHLHGGYEGHPLSTVNRDHIGVPSRQVGVSNLHPKNTTINANATPMMASQKAVR
jgi:hypothetical protein